MSGTLLCLALLLVAGSLVLLGWLVAMAPEGWEDEKGFHCGRPDDDAISLKIEAKRRAEPPPGEGLSFSDIID